MFWPPFILKIILRHSKMWETRRSTLPTSKYVIFVSGCPRGDREGWTTRAWWCACKCPPLFPLFFTLSSCCRSFSGYNLYANDIISLCYNSHQGYDGKPGESGASGSPGMKVRSSLYYNIFKVPQTKSQFLLTAFHNGQSVWMRSPLPVKFLPRGVILHLDPLSISLSTFLVPPKLFLLVTIIDLQLISAKQRESKLYYAFSFVLIRFVSSKPWVLASGDG